jgi:hypothetical protein
VLAEVYGHKAEFVAQLSSLPNKEKRNPMINADAHYADIQALDARLANLRTSSGTVPHAPEWIG